MPTSKHIQVMFPSKVLVKYIRLILSVLNERGWVISRGLFFFAQNDSKIL